MREKAVWDARLTFIPGPPEYRSVTALSVVTIYLLLIAFNVMAPFLTQLLAYTFPIYASIKSIKGGPEQNHVQWLF